MPTRPISQKTQAALSAPPSRKSATKAMVAAEHGVSLRTVNCWMAERRIPFKKLSPRLVRFDLDAVEKALARYTVKEIS
jgi:hypothetical protein